MSVVDDLIENLVERNAVTLNGAFTVALVDGGLTVKGKVLSTIRDTKKNNKVLLNVKIPINAAVTVGDIVVPVPEIR